jgi:hypothetical protein
MTLMRRQPAHAKWYSNPHRQWAGLAGAASSGLAVASTNAISFRHAGQ